MFCRKPLLLIKLVEEPILNLSITCDGVLLTTTWKANPAISKWDLCGERWMMATLRSDVPFS
jgi:hypothetical protein